MIITATIIVDTPLEIQQCQFGGGSETVQHVGYLLCRMADLLLIHNTPPYYPKVAIIVIHECKARKGPITDLCIPHNILNVKFG